MSSTSNYKKQLGLIFLVVFFDLLAFGIVIPILPFYARSFNASATQMGWLMTVFSLFQFIFSPYWGQLSDRLGRRPILIFSVLGSAVSMVVLGLAQSLIWLFAARIFAGICAANISTATAYIADVTPEEKRAGAMGMVGAAFGLGFIFGPAIGGYFSAWGYSLPMYLAAGLAFLNALFIFFWLPEPSLSTQDRKSHRREISLRAFRETLGRPRLGLYVLLFFLVTMAFVHLEVSFGYFVKDAFDYDARHAGSLLALAGIIMVIVQGGLVGRLARKYGEIKLITWGPVITAIGLFLIPFGAHWGVGYFVGALSLVSIGNGLTGPSLMSLVSKTAQKHEHGTAMGAYQSAGSLARILGPLSAGFFYDHFGKYSPFQTAALIMLGALVVLLWNRSNLRASKAV